MATRPEIAEFILEKLTQQVGEGRFATRKMFGEYALYADGVTVALICDDQLYVKMLPQSASLADMCEQDTPFPGARPHYLVEEYQLSILPDLGEILIEIAKELDKKKK